LAVRDPLVAPVHRDPLSAAAALLGHEFARPALLREALTHRSAVPARRAARGRSLPATGAGSNERLEFIGDRVLGLLIAEWLAERFPDEQEGALGPRLAYLVSQPTIAEIAERLGLPALLAVSAGEARAGVRKRATVLADAMEALIGALYLDAGLDPPRAFVRRAWAQAMEGMAAPPKDPKTALQEWVLARGLPLPRYELLAREGPPHDPVFVIGVDAGGAYGEGRAGSKRAAERLAATAVLARLAQGAQG
jgi:ribonuclease-3